MITDSVSETLIVYMYSVICCVKFLELAINEISLRHSWWKLTVDPLFFNTYNYILSENGLFLCHISGYVLFLHLHVEVSNIKHCIR